MGLDPVTHHPRSDNNNLNLLSDLQQLLHSFTTHISPNWDINNINNPLTDPTQLAKLQVLHNILQDLSTPVPFSVLHGYSSLKIILLKALSSNAFNLEAMDHLRYELLGGGLHNSKLEGVHNYKGSIGNFASNLPQPVSDCDFPSMTSSWSSLPSLVSVAPDCSPSVKKMKRMVDYQDEGCNNNNKNNPPSTSIHFETWGGFMDEEASHAYWKDLLK